MKPAFETFPHPVKAVLFDLDGVITPTAQLHEDAWGRLFSDYFNANGLKPYSDADYFEYLDGKPRYDAVASILASRGVALPYGSLKDGPDEETVCGLGNRKNKVFNDMLALEGIEPYPGSMAFLEYLEDRGDVKVAIVSSSKNAREVLGSAGIMDRFEVIVDGVVAAENAIAGKPAPDTYLEAAARLGYSPIECVIVEDAISGVEAGNRGGFAEVIGVDRGAGKVPLFSAGATVVVDDLADLLGPTIERGSQTPSDDQGEEDPDDEEGDGWAFRSSMPSTKDAEVHSTLFTIGNGYLGFRGDLGFTPGSSSRGTYLNGFHEIWRISHAEDAYGFARIGQSILTLPDATALEIEVDGTKVTTDGTLMGHLAAHERRLQMREGMQEQVSQWVTEDGNAVEIVQRAAVAAFSPHLAVITLAVKPLDKRCTVKVCSYVRSPEMGAAVGGGGDLSELDDPRLATDITSGALEEVSSDVSSDRAVFTYRARRSEMEASLACANYATHISSGGDEPLKVSSGEVTSRDAAAWQVVNTVEPGDALVFTKVLAYAREDLFEEGTVTTQNRVLTAVSEADGQEVDTFFSQQADTFESRWAHADITIGQRKAPRAAQPESVRDQTSQDLQELVRWGIYQLLQVGLQIDRTGVPAKGLSGSGYDGHYFWDSEIYLLPFLVYTNPQAAREMLHYRYLTLDAARDRAREMEEEGALFPWRTIAGAESSAYYPAGTAQYHINADIAYAVNQYVNATRDYEFLANEGVDILVETARLWMSLGFFGEDGHFHIHGVTGPDEYTAVVNDNLYTNAMARENLKITDSHVRWLRKHDPASFRRLEDVLGLTDDELKSFRRAAKQMYIGWDDGKQVHAQDDSFLTKEPWDFENTPAESYPLLLNYHPLVIYRHQVLKQADTVLAMYLLGPRFTGEEKKANFDYYDPLTTGDSSLSAVAQAIVAAEVGDSDKAFDYFNEVVHTDLANLHGNTSAGLHTASLGGIWGSLVMGFAGLRDLEQVMVFDPRLPEQWEQLRFSLLVDGFPLEVDLRSASMSFFYDAPQDVTLRVRVCGKNYRLEGSKQKRFKLASSPA